MIINRHNIGWAFALALVATHLSVEAQNYYTGPQPSYRPFVVNPNGAVILGRAVEQANGIREQYNEAAQFSANQRQLYLADQQARALFAAAESAALAV